MPRLNMHKSSALFPYTSWYGAQTEWLYLLLLLLKIECYCSVISSLTRFIINPSLQTGSWSRMLNQTLSGITYVSPGCMFYCWANSHHYRSSPTYTPPVRFMTLWMVQGTGGWCMKPREECFVQLRCQKLWSYQRFVGGWRENYKYVTSRRNP